MLQGGISLDSETAWKAWPKELPLFVWHGEDDQICDAQATKRFGENANAEDKTVELFPVRQAYEIWKPGELDSYTAD